MESDIDLTGPARPPAAGGCAHQLIVLLHGLGASGDDLIGLVPHWATLLPHAAFVAPHAPYPCDMAPVGLQWFSLRDMDAAVILAGIEAAAPILDAFVDRELARHGLDETGLALVGFSQGTMMALHVALRRRRPCAALVGYSGMLVGPERLKAEIRARPPVLLVHGTVDQVVPAAMLGMAEAELEAVGVTVTSHLRAGLGHGIDAEGIRLGGAYLERFLVDRNHLTGMNLRPG